MHVVILAGGRGTRMGALTDKLPKPMLMHNGKNLIEHKLDNLPSQIKHIILVIGYLGNKIQEYFGDSYRGIPITYIVQEKLLGTAHSLWEAKDHIHEPFMVLMGDDLYAKKDLDSMTTYDFAVLANKSERGRSGGKIFLNKDGTLRDIIEDKDGTLDSPLVYTGACMLTPEIFSYPMVQIPGRNEFGLPQTILQIRDRFPLNLVEATFWKQITSPGDLIY